MAKAALPMIPLASKLPFVAGGGGALPDRTLERTVTVDPSDVAAYARVCGFTLRDTLPPTYPHIPAFALHMELMTSGDFPFPAIGTVHLENRLTQHRPIRVTEELSLSVKAVNLAKHPKGRTFQIVTEARVGEELVWDEVSTFLRRGGGDGGLETKSARVPLPERATWKLPGDLGRRYAAVSGDANPIHMHALSAKAFGFPRAIAHGMWTKARCLAALRLPDAFTTEVAFKRPILLPAKVTFAANDDGGYEVRGRDSLHLTGTVTR
jgi:acyl dehydratase